MTREMVMTHRQVKNNIWFSKEPPSENNKTKGRSAPLCPSRFSVEAEHKGRSPYLTLFHFQAVYVENTFLL